MLRAPIKMVKRARKLRREMSPSEALLWRELRRRPGGFKFRRQFPLDPYALDFACLEARLAIEVDGESHNRGDRPQRDALRDRAVEERGFATMRIPAVELARNLEGVISGIVERCRRLGPLHRPTDGPPPRAGEDFGAL